MASPFRSSTPTGGEPYREGGEISLLITRDDPWVPAVAVFLETHELRKFHKEIGELLEELE